MNQLQHATILDTLGHSSEKPLMVDAIKELRQVDIDCNAVSFIEVAFSFGNGGLGSAITAEPMTAIMKGWFKDRFELEQNRLLNDRILYFPGQNIFLDRINQNRSSSPAWNRLIRGLTGMNDRQNCKTATDYINRSSLCLNSVKSSISGRRTASFSLLLRRITLLVSMSFR